MKLLRDRHAGDLKHTAQECHHVEMRGNDKTTTELLSGKKKLNKNENILTPLKAQII